MTVALERLVGQRMRISFEPAGRCLWHLDCVNRFGGVMKIVRHEPHASLLECLHCQKQGHYPVGAAGEQCVDVVMPN